MIHSKLGIEKLTFSRTEADGQRCVIVLRLVTDREMAHAARQK